ncbi:hypothetical protein CDL15_Pgr012774 [Punica granatum]|uniref:Myb/SANT-like domain-containing protein n=1 Tax=Punica granatum TaxID=22663 RepID=A0A218XED0_PUNGR|nr:hypothetical protein CDL15_Pgr012774 [Punica granatum]
MLKQISTGALRRRLVLCSVQESSATLKTIVSTWLLRHQAFASRRTPRALPQPEPPEYDLAATTSSLGLPSGPQPPGASSSAPTAFSKAFQTSVYATKRKEFFPQKELEMSSFIPCKNDYLSKDDLKHEGHELLFQKFGINYKKLPEMFRQGSCIFKTEVEVLVKYDENGTPIKRLKGTYRQFTELRNHTEVGWDADTNTVKASPDVWDMFIKKNMAFKAFRTKGCKHYILLVST